MKVIIVGAGISGLVQYLYLKKHLTAALSPNEDLDIVIYEKHRDSVPKAGAILIGGFLAVAPNGMRALLDLDKELYDDVCSRGHFQTDFMLKNALGWNLGGFRAQSFDDPPMKSVVIGRQRLWECIRERVPTDAIVYESVEGISFPSDSTPFFNIRGSDASHTADLIIGADGVHSALRNAVANDDKDYSPKYMGLVGVGGMFRESVALPDPPPPSAMVLTFGSNGFFGYGSISPEQSGWWSTYSMDEPPTSNKALDPEDVKKQLRERHQDWTDPNIKAFINKVEIESVYPTWTAPTIPKWSRKNVVLVGDAAHAMQPSSGQGVSQALEDAQVLAILLAHGVGKAQRSEGITSALTDFEKLRRPRAQKCVDRGNQGGDRKRKMSKIEEYMMYGFVWIMGHWPKDTWSEYLYKNVPGEEAKTFVEKEKEKEKQAKQGK